MSNWDIIYLTEVYEDISKLDKSVKEVVYKALKKVSQNPLPDFEGGYGKPLANQNGRELAGFLKIKLKKSGVRVVYKLQRTETEMLVVVVGMREDSEVYREALKRKLKYGL